MYRLQEHDINKLITACGYYKESTGSEFMWDEYDNLQRRLKNYLEQNYEEDNSTI